MGIVCKSDRLIVLLDKRIERRTWDVFGMWMCRVQIYHRGNHDVHVHPLVHAVAFTGCL